VLSGSASAIYGSDAIAGVVNFQLKTKADGTRIDMSNPAACADIAIRGAGSGIRSRPHRGSHRFPSRSFPVGLIDRVEVLSGSASAIYGSDAIAGVVNFQLKTCRLR
jgi:outer membrane receptor protein involved in Fe transport